VAYNAVTEYVDHFSLINTRKNTDQNTARLASIWLGRGSDLKKVAFDIALQFTDESKAVDAMAAVATAN